jgi:hypothetical protein
MKTTTSSRKFFHPALATALAIVIVWGFSIRPAQAGYIVTLQQLGPNVVATGSGTLDMTDLTLLLSNDTSTVARMIPSFAQLIMGPTGGGTIDDYTGYTGPTNFGSGFITDASSGSGDTVFMAGDPGNLTLAVPAGYISGNPLSASDIYSGQTFSSLGVTPGTYIWSWGTGVHADSFTLIAVPDSGSTLGLLVVSSLALFGVSRFRALRIAYK